MRLFLAIELEEDIRGKIANIESEIRQKDVDVKFVEPENLHLTLKFLGEVGEDKLSEIESKVSGDLRGVKQFKISIEDFGYFGSPNHIRTLWVDVKEGKDRLIALIEGFNRNLNHIRRENHKPNPHLTIGRVRSGRNREVLLREIERLRGVKIGEFVVKEVKLKKSTLTGQCPIYEDVKVFGLE